MSWFWEFGDGNTSTLQNPTHVFPGNPNEFLVKLKVTLLNGCGFAQRSKSINFTRPLVQANFTSSSECGNLTVSFSNTSTISTGVINTWFWDFGDGNTSNQQNPVHSYNTTGNYQVKLTATYSTGCVVTHSVTKPLDVNPKPASLFSASEVCAGFPTVFADQSSVSPGAITGWYWNFGDGFTSNLQHPTHTYATGGNYVVKMVAKSAAGCDSDTALRTISVNYKPVAGFTFSDNCVSAPVQFQNISTVTNATINKWHWSFGDGGNSTVMDPSHIYATGGFYEIKHAVTTDKGCFSDTLRKIISIDAKPTALFTIANGCVNNALNPSNSSTTVFGNIGSYYWDFGNGNTSTETLPGISYAQPGPYLVKLVAYSQNGCISDTAQTQVIIESYPKADFDFGPACAGKEINFQNLTTNDYGVITSWTWAFGNGGTSNIFNPSYTYNTFGNYTITLKASTLNGCENDISKSINIRKVTISAGADTTIVKGQPLQLNASGALSYAWSPGLYLSDGNIANPIALLPQSMEYTVEGTTSEGCIGKAKINIKVFEENKIYVPTAFTPNGDGLNDILRPVIPGIAKLEYFSIYNRWGELVFTTKEIGKGWDGRKTGKDQPNSVFVWIVKAVDYKGQILSGKGTTTLLK